MPEIANEYSLIDDDSRYTYYYSEINIHLRRIGFRLSKSGDKYSIVKI